MTRTVQTLAVVLAAGFCHAADEPASETFDSILAEEQKRTFVRISKYVSSHPDAADRQAARSWLLSAALELGLEGEAIAHADAVLESDTSSDLIRTLARQVRVIGLARNGQADEAVREFTGLLRFARLSSGGAMIDFGRRFATQLRMQRDFAAAREVYSQISSRFFLNADVRGMCDNLIAKIDLIDQPAPEIGVPDTTGQTIDLSTFTGKVVLIDFWATNCPPCLEEIPNLQKLYSRYRNQGFEIIGVSLDGDESLVASFTQRMQMPWPQIVNEDDVEALRERYLVRTIPTLMIVGPDGRVAQFDVRGTDLKQTVENLLTAR